MTPRAEELTVAILQIIADGNLGTDATGHFAKLDDIVEEIGNKHDTVSIIKHFLIPKSYIRKVNDKFKSVHNHELEYEAYQITQLGKTYLSKHFGGQSFNVGSNVNFAYNSPGAKQIIEISELDDDLKQKVNQLYGAIANNDKPAFKKALLYIADKSVDVAIGLVTGSVVR